MEEKCFGHILLEFGAETVTFCHSFQLDIKVRHRSLKRERICFKVSLFERRIIKFHKTHDYTWFKKATISQLARRYVFICRSVLLELGDVSSRVVCPQGLGGNKEILPPLVCNMSSTQLSPLSQS